MKNISLNRFLCTANVLIVCYFIVLRLLYHYEIQHVLIGVFVEILTLPFLLAQGFFLIFGFVQVVKRPLDYLLLVSLLLLTICTYLTVGNLV